MKSFKDGMAEIENGKNERASSKSQTTLPSPHAQADGTAEAFSKPSTSKQPAEVIEVPRQVDAATEPLQEFETSPPDPIYNTAEPATAHLSNQPQDLPQGEQQHPQPKTLRSGKLLNEGSTYEKRKNVHSDKYSVIQKKGIKKGRTKKKWPLKVEGKNFTFRKDVRRAKKS